MTEFFQWLSSGSVLVTLFISIILLIVVVISAIFLIAFFQGREISFWPPKVGEKKKTTDADVKQNNLGLSESQMDAIISKVKERIKAESSKLLVQNYEPPPLNEQFIYIYAVRHELKRLISAIVLLTGGGWAGCSMAHFDTYFQLASQNNLLSQKLEEEIGTFLSWTDEILNTERISSKEDFLEIRFLAAEIINELDVLEKHSRARSPYGANQ